MKLATYSLPHDPSARVGVLVADRLVDLRDLGLASVPASMLELVQAGPDVWARVRHLADRAQAARHADGHDPATVVWHAPIPRPTKNVMCLGLNYASHVLETSKPLQREAKNPEVPIFFTKAPTAVTGPRDPILWDPDVTGQVDYEVELGVVIGRRGRSIGRAGALAHVFGYTIVNDVSARDLQHRHKQWFKGKSLDTFCPMGPYLVTADEFGDPQRKQLSLKVNGDLRQHSSTSDMIFPVDAIIECLSRGMTIEPGDIIATGTPEGVGLGRTPPEYLTEGDVVEAEIEGIGVMRNHVVRF